MFGMAHRGELDGNTESEFEGLIAKLRRFLLQEHKEDGTHAAINADSLTLVADNATGATGDIDGGGEIVMTGTGTSSVGGNFRANTAGAGQVEIGGTLGTASGNDGMIGPGVDINPNEQNSAPRLRWLTALGTFRELRLLWTRGAVLADCPLQVRDDTILGGYAVMPGKGTTPSKNVYLGSNTDAGSAGYWNGVFGRKFFRPEYASAQGEWTDEAYAAGNFTANGGTWTPPGAGAQITYTYSVVGKQLTVSWIIAGTAVSAGVIYLQLAIPNGYVAAKDMRGCHFAQDNGAAQVASLCRVVAAGTSIILYATAGAGPWANTGGANTTSTQGTFTFAIQ